MNSGKPFGRGEMVIQNLELAESDDATGRRPDPARRYGLAERLEIVLPLEEMDCSPGSLDRNGHFIDDRQRLVLSVRTDVYPQVLANILEIISAGTENGTRERLLAAAQELAKLGAGIAVEPKG